MSYSKFHIVVRENGKKCRKYYVDDVQHSEEEWNFRIFQEQKKTEVKTRQEEKKETNSLMNRWRKFNKGEQNEI